MNRKPFAVRAAATAASAARSRSGAPCSRRMPAKSSASIGRLRAGSAAAGVTLTELIRAAVKVPLPYALDSRDGRVRSDAGKASGGTAARFCSAP